VIIGERIRELRESKELSQRDVEEKTGLLRCYLCRVENGTTLPALPTLQKLASAFRVPLYFFFYDGKQPPRPTLKLESDEGLYGVTKKEKTYLSKLGRAMGKLDGKDQQLILMFSQSLLRHRK
jgi:transcriptional regulator with XRE-family HTH domain